MNGSFLLLFVLVLLLQTVSLYPLACSYLSWLEPQNTGVTSMCHHVWLNNDLIPQISKAGNYLVSQGTVVKLLVTAFLQKEMSIASASCMIWKILLHYLLLGRLCFNSLKILHLCQLHTSS